MCGQNYIIIDIITRGKLNPRRSTAHMGLRSLVRVGILNFAHKRESLETEISSILWANLMEFLL